MKCLVTGAAGFIGSTLCDELLHEGNAVVGIDSFTPYYPRTIKDSNLAKARDHRDFRLVEEDLLTADMTNLLDETEVVFHLAAQPGVRSSWERDFEIYVQHNILATQRLLEACRNAKPGRVIFASSSSVYGNVKALPVGEETCGQPVSPYGMTKLAAEHLCNVYHTAFGVPVISVRYFTVYGPRQRPDMAFHRFIRSGIAGETITVFGDGSQTRDFTYVADAISATIAASKHGYLGTTYNIGGGSTWSIREVLSAINKLVGTELSVRHVPPPAGDVRDTAAAIDRARQELGYEPATPVDVGLAREMEWIEDGLASGIL